MIEAIQDIYINSSKYPCPETTEIREIYSMDYVTEEYRKNHFKTYSFKGIPVPRVSNILSECINKEFLVKWAASIGTEEMDRIRDRATTIGSVVHEMIETHLCNPKALSSLNKIKLNVAEEYKLPIITAYNNFIAWENNLHSMGYRIEEIIGVEIPVVCPYYGGTVDCIMRINGAYYIVDFKTSKSISYEYILQTIAYLWAINSGYSRKNISVDGIGIIRIDKEKENKFEDYFLNLEIPSQCRILEIFADGFFALLNSYYNLINVKGAYYDYKKQYNFEKLMEDYSLWMENQEELLEIS